MKRLVRASYLGYREPALIPAFSRRRRRIIVRLLVTMAEYSDSLSASKLWRRWQRHLQTAPS
jgi:hypothetical protein